MTVIALVVVIVVLAGVLAAQTRSHREAIGALTEQHIAFADRLCQRIQAPAEAVFEHAIQAVPPSPPSVGFDDDDGFHESKEDFANRMMREELLAQAEAA